MKFGNKEIAKLDSKNIIFELRNDLISSTVEQEPSNYKSYRIEYYNRVFKLSNTIETPDFDDAIDKARSISELFEIENVKLYEMKEIDFN